MDNVIITQNLEETLQQALQNNPCDRLFLLTDTTTHELCKPLVEQFPCMNGAQEIVIGATDTHKTLQTLASVWEQLQKGGATRHSLLVSLGGGMVTDLGGFAASTFKRGIRYINIPTTLLAMVDASVGGKTGINFGGLKNEIGVFSEAQKVIIHTAFLRSLDDENLLSGYAEMLKHGLISTPQHLHALLAFPIEDWREHLEELAALIRESVAVKANIVEQDPHEQNLRKALNLGHTFGHAFESHALTTPRPLLHGYAVAYGLVCELFLSCVQCGFPTDTMRPAVQFVREHYGTPRITCDDYPTLIQLMRHDKKNTGDSINFTLLSGVGQLQLNQTATTKTIEEALDFLREGL